MSDTVQKIKRLIERYSNAQVQSELAYERDAGRDALARYDEKEKAAWDALVAAIEELAARADKAGP